MKNQEQGFGVIYLWNFIAKQSNNTNQLLVTKAAQAFAVLLSNLYYAKQIERFVILSIKGIQARKNIQSLLKVIHESLKICREQRMTKAIESAQKQIGLIDCVMKILKEEKNLSELALQNMFQFLQEVNFISRKPLKITDIIILWQLKAYRNYLLKFLRKQNIKDTEDISQHKIINKKLNIDQIQNIIFKIFLDKLMMKGYKEIDTELYQTVDELIMAFLHHKGFIEYNYKHTIRFYKNEQIDSNPDSLYPGSEFYLKVIENCENDDFIKKAAIRFVEIYLKPRRQYKNSIEAKTKAWIKVSRAFSKLKNNSFKSFQVQFQQIKGRMKSFNIVESQPLDIVVLNNDTNQMITLSVPRYTSLWKFRLILGQCFDLKQTNFTIQLVQQRTTTNLQRQEDLSVSFISLVKDMSCPSVIVHPNKQLHPHFQSINKFKQSFSDLFGQQLYKKLQLKDPEVLDESFENLIIQKQTDKIKKQVGSMTSSSFTITQKNYKIMMKLKNQVLLVNVIDNINDLQHYEGKFSNDNIPIQFKFFGQESAIPGLFQFLQQNPEQKISFDEKGSLILRLKILKKTIQRPLPLQKIKNSVQQNLLKKDQKIIKLTNQNNQLNQKVTKLTNQNNQLNQTIKLLMHLNSELQKQLQNKQNELINRKEKVRK